MRKLIVVTDGSNLDGKKFGWAFVLKDDEQPNSDPTIMSGTDLWCPDWSISWNVAAECTAVLQAVKHVIDAYDLERSLVDTERVPLELEILHDYEGLSLWVSHEWSANKPVSAGYVKELMKLLASAPGLTLKWTWQKGHSGHPLNDLADRYAKAAMLREEVKDVIPHSNALSGDCMCSTGTVILAKGLPTCTRCGSHLTSQQAIVRLVMRVEELEARMLLRREVK